LADFLVLFRLWLEDQFQSGITASQLYACLAA